ncbi:hypothetical protein RRG08_030174 [Elysia crispata]|uniref:Uncharacterized protein n=1 Tax=Elysia crispata TaxID=231223 RepID=A0AAE1DKR7_9GAST|nr:hypothetical protein RRG08_030174 [Elysia crispata]
MERNQTGPLDGDWEGKVALTALTVGAVVALSGWSPSWRERMQSLSDQGLVVSTLQPDVATLRGACVRTTQLLRMANTSLQNAIFGNSNWRGNLVLTPDPSSLQVLPR